MKLCLTNFCCWEKEEFIFPDTGNILLSAPSGFGKTSIVRAIMFAIFGTGYKIIMHGKRNCRVELTYKDLHIVRSKGPCRLVVNGTLEDEAAEAIIRKYFDSNMFYLKQGGNSNFVTMGPTDKLAYLEQIVFHNIDIVGMKAKIKDIIKQRGDMLATKKTQLQSIEDVLGELVVLPIVDLPNDIRSTSSSDANCKYKELYIESKKIAQDRQTYDQMIHRQNQCILQLDSEKRILCDKERQFDRCLVQISEYDNVDTRLYNCQSILQYILDADAYDKLREEYIAQKEVYESIKSRQNSLKEKIDAIENKIGNNIGNNIGIGNNTERGNNVGNNIGNNIGNIEKCIDQYKKYASDYYLRKSLEEEFDSIFIKHAPEYYSKAIETLSTVLQNAESKMKDMDGSYTCPQCNVGLKLQSDTLVIDQGQEYNREETHRVIIETKSALDSLKQEYHTSMKCTDRKTQLQSKIQTFQIDMDIDSIMSTLRHYEDEYKTMISEQALINEYKSQLHTTNVKYTNVKISMNDIQRQCKQLALKMIVPDVPQPYDPIDQIKQDIENLQRQSGLLTHYIDEKNAIETDIKAIKNRIETITEEKVHIDKQVTSLADVIERQEYIHSMLNIYQMEMDLFARYEAYKTSKDTYDMYQSKRSLLETEIQSVEKLVVSACLFKEAVLKSETTALSNLIYTLNLSVQTYLDVFFEKEPLQARVLCVKHSKTGKKQKPEVNITLHHKGNQVDLDSLSGGELDRVILAFSLAMADMTNSPLVLLDECVSSLDQVNADIVFDCIIKTNRNNKLVILIAHQIVTGMFDSMLRLKMKKI